MEASSRLLLQKLGLKDGKSAVFLHIPEQIQAFCGAGAEVPQTLGKGHDVILAFYESSKHMKLELPQLKASIKPTGMIWVCWKRGEFSDVSRDLIWQLGEECGLSSVSSVAIDDQWLAMKLMYPKHKRQKVLIRS